MAHHADQLAERLGEPLGTLVLTGSVIVIELALIASTMLTGDSNPTLARDSMFSVLMIVLTGVKGVTVIVAARVQRQGRTQPMQPEDLATVNQSGSSAYINLITTISVLALVLPNFSQDSPRSQLLPADQLAADLRVHQPLRDFSARPGRPLSQTCSSLRLNPRAPGPCPSRTAPQRKPTPEDEHQASILRSGALMAAGLLVLVLIAESMGSLIENRHQRPRPARLPGRFTGGACWWWHRKPSTPSKPLERGSCNGRSTPSTGRLYRPCASRCRRFWRSASSLEPM